MLEAMEAAGVADVTYEMKEKKVRSDRRGARLRPRGCLIGMMMVLLIMMVYVYGVLLPIYY